MRITNAFKILINNSSVIYKSMFFKLIVASILCLIGYFIIANDVGYLVNSPQVHDFWNAIFNSGEEIPEFKVTLPAFCGGGTYNVLDLRFYAQYRDYIHGLIAGICYFVYIKKLYHNLPNIIR